MSTATFTDKDLEDIADAAVRLTNGEFVTDKEYANIVDGDEDIPIIVKNLAKLRFVMWINKPEAIRFLELARETDQNLETKGE